MSNLANDKKTIKPKPIMFASLLALLLVSCGREPHEVGSGTVRLATEAEAQRIEVLVGSYVIGIKDPRTPALALQSFSGYLSESRFHNSFLTSSPKMLDPRLKDLRYIAMIDLVGSSPNRLSRLRQDEDLFAPAWLTKADPLDYGKFDSGDLTPVPTMLAEATFRSPQDAAAVLGEWTKLGLLHFAEPNYINRLQGDFDKFNEDFTSGSQFWHKAIRLSEGFAAIEARDLSKGVSDQAIAANPPVIAVMDSGLDTGHKDFKDRLFVNPSPGASGCAGDLHGCDTTKATKERLGIGEVHPYSTAGPGEPCPAIAAGSAASGSSGVDGSCAHGTHVAGIIAANYSSEEQAGGVCPVCKIMTIKIISEVNGKGVATDTAILNGLKYLTVFKQDGRSVVRVINSSFGKYARSRAVALLVNVLRSPPYNMLMIGAAGNENSMLRQYPGALSEAIGVTSVNKDFKKSYFSNFGMWADIAAPGGDNSADILSTEPGDTYGSRSGTSMAAPMVAGAAGLLLAVEPNLTATGLKERLIETANPAIYQQNFNYYLPPDSQSQRIPLLGSGVLDVAAAINKQSQQAPVTPPLNRVQSGCGIIGDVSKEGSAFRNHFIEPNYHTDGSGPSEARKNRSDIVLLLLLLGFPAGFATLCNLVSGNPTV